MCLSLLSDERPVIKLDMCPLIDVGVMVWCFIISEELVYRIHSHVVFDINNRYVFVLSIPSLSVENVD